MAFTGAALHNIGRKHEVSNCCYLCGVSDNRRKLLDFAFMEGFVMKEALKLALEALMENEHYVAENERHAYVVVYNKIIEKCKAALAQPEERNFCSRCGKRTADLTVIHTCTPPRENT